MSSRRKLIELIVLACCLIGLFFVLPDVNEVILFALGFIWNWSASQKVAAVLESKQYRFSFFKVIYNLHRPLEKLPALLASLLKVFPAGLFWTLVILFAESNLPVWPVFCGSLVYELIQLPLLFIRASDTPPAELP